MTADNYDALLGTSLETNEYVHVYVNDISMDICMT